MPEYGRRIKLTISYDGSSFHGWQEQSEGETVQSTIKKVLEDLLGEEVSLQGSGRTDSGVHALAQVAHFDTTSTLEASRFQIILNSRLPHTIRILSSEDVSGIFHARFTSYAREYWYYIKEWKDTLPFDSGRVTSIKRLPDITLLNKYARLLEGTHDFTTFCSAKDPSESKYRDIYVSVWSEEKDNWGMRFFKYRVVGNAFLYHQVRSMVGTMIECALKEESVESFEMRLLSSKRENALKTYPPSGLYLARISYDEEEYRWFEDNNE